MLATTFIYFFPSSKTSIIIDILQWFRLQRFIFLLFIPFQMKTAAFVFIKKESNTSEWMFFDISIFFYFFRIFFFSLFSFNSISEQSSFIYLPNRLDWCWYKRTTHTYTYTPRQRMKSYLITWLCIFSFPLPCYYTLLLLLLLLLLRTTAAVVK